MRHRILLALGLALLAAGAAAQEPVRSTLLLQTDRTNTGAAIAYPEGPPEITTMIVELEPGASTVRHKHPHPTHGYVLEGELEVVAADGTRNRYKTGDAFVEALDAWHQGFNVGAGPVRVLVTFIGVKDMPNTVAAE